MSNILKTLALIMIGMLTASFLIKATAPKYQSGIETELVYAQTKLVEARNEIEEYKAAINTLTKNSETMEEIHQEHIALLKRQIADLNFRLGPVQD